MAQLKIVKLCKKYKKRQVVDNISFNVESGQIVSLLGPNGAGKTTTFYMVAGLIKAGSGEVFFDDINISKMPIYKRAVTGIIYLPQEHYIFRGLTVRNNLLAVLERRKELSAAEKIKLCDELLDELEITRIQHQLGNTLSGGETRRTEIARAMAMSPKFLLLDEPFAGVDPIAIGSISLTISFLAKEKNVGVLITDHNASATLRVSDYTHIVYQGKIMTSGASDEIKSDEKALTYYLGHGNL